MANSKSITITKGVNGLKINNPTDYPLIGSCRQGAVFRLSEKRCLKIYYTKKKAKMEQEALKAGQHLSFMPKVYKSGPNYVIMDYFNAPTLKDYLKDSMYMQESMAKKLLAILKGLRASGYSVHDVHLSHILVVENEELKVINHTNAFKRNQHVPIKLLRDLKLILLKDSFLAHVKNLEPEIYEEWDHYFNESDIDFRDIEVEFGRSGKAVRINRALPLPLIGKGHQGAVYRVNYDQCVKIYPSSNSAKKEKDVLLSYKHLPFLPKVYETGQQYVLMEYLFGPDLNSFLKEQRNFQRPLPEYLTRQILDMLKMMKAEGFKLIDAPLRHTFYTVNGLKLIGHVYSFTREQNRPIELFKDLQLLDYLDEFLKQVKEIDPKIYKEWVKSPIPLIRKKINYVGPHIKDESIEDIMTPGEIVEKILLKDPTTEINYDEKLLIY